MDRRKFSLATATGVLATTVAAPAARAQTPGQVRWRLVSSFPRTLGMYQAAEIVSKRVEKLTGGAFQIRVFPPGEIVPGLQVLDAVEQGTVECGHTAGYYYGGKESALAIDTCLPFGMGIREHNAWMYYGGGLDLLRAVYQRFGCINFPAGHTGTQMGGWWRSEVKTLGDLKGKKMRIPGLGGAIMSKLGVIPQQLAGGDIYPALERGTIDAAEWSVPFDDEKLGFYKVAKFYYSPAFWEPTASFSVLVNLKAWQALPPAFQEALETACYEAHIKVPAAYDAANPDVLKRLIAQGVQLRSFSKEIMDAAWAATKQVMEEESAKSADFKRIFASYSAFQRSAAAWERVAENPLQNYSLYQAK